MRNGIKDLDLMFDVGHVFDLLVPAISLSTALFFWVLIKGLSLL